MYMYVSVYVWDLMHHSRGQRTFCAYWFFPSTMWVPEIKLGSLALVTRTFTQWAISQALLPVFRASASNPQIYILSLNLDTPSSSALLMPTLFLYFPPAQAFKNVSYGGWRWRMTLIPALRGQRQADILRNSRTDRATKRNCSWKTKQ